jgi:hypothetical protein
MNTPPAIPPVVHPRRAIRYQLTRWDIFANWMTVILRNRMLQAFVLVALIVNAWLVLSPGFGTRPFSGLVFEGVGYIIGFVAILALAQCVMGMATAFLLKQRGVVGEHILEITEQGLIERTDCNETLHKWSSVCRIQSLGPYLYIYVGDNNSHQVPKRCFSAEELSSFEAALRMHAPGR